MLTAAAVLAAFAAAAGAATGVLPSLKDAVLAGDAPPAPQAERELPVVGGDGHRALEAFRGRIVVVTFIASWCEPCRHEARLVDEAGARLRANGTGTALLIATLDSEKFAAAFVAGHGLSLPVLSDADGTVARAYGVSGIPSTFVLDARGRVVAITEGVHPDRESLQADIAKARPG